MSELEVVHRPEDQRFDALLDGERIGLADYHRRDDVVTMTHTEVAPAHGGQGNGERLVRGALDHWRAEGVRVVPRCWFVAQVIDEHPEYADLLVR